MNWYVAKIVFNIISGDGNHAPQFDEQYRLVRAASLEDAFYKAKQIGINEEEIMVNTDKEVVKWEFVNIAELLPVSELKDGMELFSSIHETESRESYIETVHLKAAYVRSKLEAEMPQDA